jgi:16S rRNA (uracil1498-N3)-methyltransferase
MERYRKISIAAAKQCGRLFLPKTTGPAAFTDTLNELHQIYPGADLLYGDPEGPPLTETAGPANRSDRIIAIGPEGGLTDAEIETLNTAGGRGVSISPNVLRIETAAVAFCAILGAYCLK